MDKTTSSETFPRPSVYYRIQSADLAQYLELSDVNDEALVMRPFKKTLDQQWTFVPSNNSDGTFKILNAATENLRSPRYLGFLTQDYDSNPPKAVEPDKVDALGLVDSDNPQTWTVKTTEPDLYTLTCKSSKRRYEIFLAIKDESKPGPQEVQMSNDMRVPPKRKWDVQEVDPSVPKDTYRIRTLTGHVITTKAGTSTVTAEALAKGKLQEWQVEPKGNGKCTIKSATENKFLAWEKGKNGFAEIAKTELPQVWTVRSLGEFSHRITASYMMDKEHITLALSSNGPDSEVVLKPKKISYNQIWLFEAVDVSNADIVDPPPKYEPPSTRYPEITARAYYIKNVGTQNWMYMASSPWRVYPYNGASYTYNLDYVGNSSEFTLRYSSSYYFEVLGDLLVIGNQNTTKWILDRDSDPQGAKCYYICLASRPSMVITGDTRNDVNGYPFFILAPKSPGYTRQQWYLS